VAAILIKVEDHLDDDLVGLILPRTKNAGDGESPDQDFQQVQGAVLRECVVNLARIKEYVAQNVSGTLDAAGFDNWPELMRGINAGLLMLGKSRAVEIIEEITTHLKRVMQPGGTTLAPDYLDRLADAIVSLEYYIETLQAGRSDPWYMLDNARACLDALKRAPERVAPPTVTAATTGSYAKTLLIDRPPPVGDTTDVRRLDLSAVPPMLGAAVDSPHTETLPDPDLIQLFVEEAKEELAKIQLQFPIWDHSPLESDALLVVRRSFHTLKGSGRMVNARAISDFAWAIENLLNRILDGTLQRSPAVLQTLRAAIAGLPQLIAELESGSPDRGELAPLAARAHALASGREDIALTPTPIPFTATSIPASIVPRAAAPKPADTLTAAAPLIAAAAEPDTALREIYARETASHVSMVRGWLARERRIGAPHVLPEEVYRACHTLAGSSTMAEARHGIRLADPMNHWLRKAFDSGVGLDDSDLIVLGDCMVAMEAVAGHLDEGTGFFVMHDTLRGRIARAELDLDRRIAEANEFAGRSSISLSVPPLLSESEASMAPQEAPLPPLAVMRPVPVAAPTPLTPPAAATPTAARAPLAAPTDTNAADHSDFDPEIAAIFSEEAVELLEAAESALAAWNASPNDSQQVAALRRPLHTLKGGAHMAGIHAMGELAHELESLVGRIEIGLASADEAARGVAQEALDELARMREATASGRPAARVQALIARIQSVAAGEAPAPAIVAPTQTLPVLPPPAVETSPFQEISAEAPWGEASPAASVSEPVGDTVMLAMPEPEWHPQPELQPEPEFQSGPEWQLTAEPEPEPMPTFETAATVEPPPEQTVVMTLAEPPPPPSPLPPGREPVVAADRVDMARVSAELLDQLLNNAGEVSISRARLEQQLGSIEFNLGELSRTVTRLKEQLRKLEMETEAQILHRHENEVGHRQEFDPLELDRYSSIQQFSRALAESANDVASIQGLLESLIAEAQNLLQQQSRTVTELQNGLMRTRMVSVQRHVQRLARIVRQAASDTGKRAELIVEGASGELDRQVLERMLPPFEHMLRNAVVHGIESPAERIAAGKEETGHIHLSLKREGAEVIVEVRDDGAGMNLSAIRAKGLELGLIRTDQVLSDEDVMQLVLEPGFSTASSLTQQAGRGVGMDVVAVEVKKLGGALHMESALGRGTHFTIRLPFTLAISHALVVRTGDEFYALPLPTVEGVVRLTRDEVTTHLRSDSASFNHGGQKYRLQPLPLYVGIEASPLPDGDVTIPVVLVRAGEHSTGLVADELIGTREIVVKPVGPQISGIRGISGATVLGDGRIVIILDIGALVRAEWRGRSRPIITRDRTDRRTFALVVDDSITVRRVTQRLLERNGMRVMTARDGMDAVALLAENVPDIILLDIEMPRMDGYEVAAHVRNDPRLREVPIIMITSRVGEKHRARAIELGVNDYLGKPYQESQLIDAITPLVAQRRARARASSAGR
jgi:chemosensory pili system protein ChpA (sensor histidine kinase/response regulator)